MRTQLRKFDTDRMTGAIMGGALAGHRYPGRACWEHTTEVCLEAALRQRGLQVERQVSIPVPYLDVDPNGGYTIDLRVEREVVVEPDALATGGRKRVLRKG